MKNGKRPPSNRILSTIRVQSVKHNVKQDIIENATIENDFTYGGVLELADRQDLGSCVGRRVGSSPTFPTIYKKSSVNSYISYSGNILSYPSEITSFKLIFLNFSN